ncbi:hypothetical protein MLD63_01050 (plasmid) [Paracoccus sp. TK19116]|uniref:Uncharacterized protein n=1 Tax=Paracoccus albicereus TaxID=2922394 RepID=A0ABT1ML47_9RHOB|nr:hypothetical protein [Paracoccus albicereus]MCQ0969022.1 hypothetical protein [Paracoccus albicereus]
MSRLPFTVLTIAALTLGTVPVVAQEATPVPQTTMPTLPQGEATAQQTVPSDDAAPVQTRPMPASGGSRCGHSKGLTS